MIYHDVLEAVGNTPLIRLNRMTGPEDAEVLVKFEAVNVGGSIKTRTALNMIQTAEKEGKIRPDTIIVEPTSGNQGIGLALIGAVKGYQTKIIMPDSVSEERRKLVQNYGAEVILIHDEGNIGACIEKCMETALQMEKDDPRVFVPQQFANEANRRTESRPGVRSWSRRENRFMASAPASAQGVPLPAWERLCGKRIRIF